MMMGFKLTVCFTIPSDLWLTPFLRFGRGDNYALDDNRFIKQFLPTIG